MVSDAGVLAQMWPCGNGGAMVSDAGLLANGPLVLPIVLTQLGFVIYVHVAADTMFFCSRKIVAIKPS